MRLRYKEPPPVHGVRADYPPAKGPPSDMPLGVLLIEPRGDVASSLEQS